MDRHRQKDRPGQRQYFYANSIARITIEALQEVMGRNGVSSVLRIAGLPHLLDHIPPNNLNKEFNFTDYAAIFQALESLYGPSGGRWLALQTGRAMFPPIIREFGPLIGFTDLAFNVLPGETKFRLSLTTITDVINQIGDQEIALTETPTEILYTVHHCPICMGRTGIDKPVCFLTTGFLIEGLKWVSGGQEYRVYEKRCSAMGDDVCEFVIPREPFR